MEGQPITDGQVKTAIAVLRAYVDGTLQTDLCDELDAAIEAAWNALLDDKVCDYDEPSESPWQLNLSGRAGHGHLRGIATQMAVMFSVGHLGFIHITGS